MRVIFECEFLGCYNAPMTPMRIPLAGRHVLLYVLVDATVFFSNHRTLVYTGLFLTTSL